MTFQFYKVIVKIFDLLSFCSLEKNKNNIVTAVDIECSGGPSSLILRDMLDTKICKLVVLQSNVW